MDRAEMEKRLRDMPSTGWFARQPAPLRRQLLDGAVDVHFADGDWIYGATEKAGGFFCVLDGGIRLYAATSHGETVLIDLVGPGRWFGQAGVLRDGQRLVTAIADGPVLALLIPRNAIVQLIRQSPQFIDSIMQLDAVHFQYMTRVVSEVLTLAPRERIAGRLYSLCDRVAPEAGRWRIPLTQADLAEMVGVERKTVNRVLAAFEKRGLVKRSYGAIELPDRAALARIRDTAPK